jgi:hypothetical protein
MTQVVGTQHAYAHERARIPSCATDALLHGAANAPGDLMVILW